MELNIRQFSENASQILKKNAFFLQLRLIFMPGQT